MTKYLPHYRTVLFSTFFLIFSQALAASEPDGQMVLADFDGQNVGDQWQTVNDNVMGGRSKGGPSFKDGILTFSGATNTNGGGFSSIRTKPGSFDLSGKAGLLIRAKGDGRTYRASMRTDVMIGRWNVPFRAEFKTVKGEWREFFLPFESFTPSMFGRALSNPPAFEAGKVSSVGFMIYDKKDGPFKLEVDWVKAVTSESTSASAGGRTIIDRALQDGRFSTLADALKAADLIDLLAGDGPFTVFAPTDEAFSKLPKGTVKELLKKENRVKLQAILKYHVSPGAIRLATALDARTAKTAQGERIAIGFTDGRVKVNEASLVNADIDCSNGVIHVIDTVLLPPEPRNDIPSVAKRAGVFKTLLAAAKAAGLQDALSGDGPLTILAPTDKAFEALPQGTVKELLKKENRNRLRAILSYHVIQGHVTAGDALNARKAATLNGLSVSFAIEEGLFKVNGATIRKADIECDNGVIHIIDTVLLPPSAATQQVTNKTGISAAERIEQAIDQGVPIFNNGDAAKCAAIYKACLEGLATDESIDASTRTAIKQILQFAAHYKNDTARAWMYRRGLDRAYHSLTNS